MAVLSVLRLGTTVLRPKAIPACLFNITQKMSQEHQTMNIQPSRWQWHKTKDMFHFYFMLGVIPLSILTFLVNIYIGPAQLTEIPEGYIPKKHEYYRHPISRCMMHYLFESYQQNYEKYLQVLYEEFEKKEMRGIEKKVKQLMRSRGDSRSYYYDPVITKYHRRVRKMYEDSKNVSGFF